MSGPRNEHFTNMVLSIIVIGLVIASILYVGFLFWPYVIFYVLPLIFSTMVVGWILRISIAHLEGGGKVEGDSFDSKKYYPIYHYRNLLVVYPVMIFVALLVFEMNSGQRVALDKKGNEVGIYLDWPGINKTFNEYRSSTYASSPFDSLKESATESVLYDRRQIGWIVWFALFLSGPIYCYWLSRSDYENEGLFMYKQIESLTESTRESLRIKIQDQDKIVQGRVSKYQVEIDDLRAGYAEVMAENKILKATVEYSSEVPKPLSDSKVKGVLDSDLF